MAQKLRDVLSRYSRVDAAPLGGAAIVSADGDGLRRDLAAVIRRNEVYFRLLWLSIASLFMISLWVVWFWRNDLSVVRGVLGVLGISTIGLVRMMRDVWREKSRSEMLAILATSLDPATMQTVVTVLGRNL